MLKKDFDKTIVGSNARKLNSMGPTGLLIDRGMDTGNNTDKNWLDKKRDNQSISNWVNEEVELHNSSIQNIMNKK